MIGVESQLLLPARDYDLAATLTSGQAFRWEFHDGGWEGIVGSHWVRLRQQEDGLLAQTAVRVKDLQRLEDYLQTKVNLDSILLSFPDDAPMRAAVNACRGLRLLRQDPW